MHDASSTDAQAGEPPTSTENRDFACALELDHERREAPGEGDREPRTRTEQRRD